MTDLGMMTGKAALRLAKEESGLTRDEIAERLGVSHSVTKRYFNINDTYMPSLEMIPRLCLALGNDILMRWLEARLQGGESFSREEIEEEMVRAANAFEELRTLVNEDPPPSRDLVRTFLAQEQRGLAIMPLVEVLEEMTKKGRP